MLPAVWQLRTAPDWHRTSSCSPRSRNNAPCRRSRSSPPSAGPLAFRKSDPVLNYSPSVDVTRRLQVSDHLRNTPAINYDANASLLNPALFLQAPECSEICHRERKQPFIFVSDADVEAPKLHAETTAVGIVRTLDELEQVPSGKQIAIDDGRRVPSLPICASITASESDLVRLRNQQRRRRNCRVSYARIVHTVHQVYGERVVNDLVAKRVVFDSPIDADKAV